MKSIKPGRGPSAMGAFGGVMVAVFGVFWTVFAASSGAPPIFCMFGVVFIIVAVMGTVYNFKNATGKNRMSEYDITDENEEPDPLQVKFHNPANNGHAEIHQEINSSKGVNFCPFCRSELKNGFKFCPGCGKDISNI